MCYYKHVLVCVCVVDVEQCDVVIGWNFYFFVFLLLLLFIVKLHSISIGDELLLIVANRCVDSDCVCVCCCRVGEDIVLFFFIFENFTVKWVCFGYPG